MNRSTAHTSHMVKALPYSSVFTFKHPSFVLVQFQKINSQPACNLTSLSGLVDASAWVGGGSLMLMRAIFRPATSCLHRLSFSFSFLSSSSPFL